MMGSQGFFSWESVLCLLGLVLLSSARVLLGRKSRLDYEILILALVTAVLIMSPENRLPYLAGVLAVVRCAHLDPDSSWIRPALCGEGLLLAGFLLPEILNPGWQGGFFLLGCLGLSLGSPTIPARGVLWLLGPSALLILSQPLDQRMGWILAGLAWILGGILPGLSLGKASRAFFPLAALGLGLWGGPELGPPVLALLAGAWMLAGEGGWARFAGLGLWWAGLAIVSQTPGPSPGLLLAGLAVTGAYRLVVDLPGHKPAWIPVLVIGVGSLFLFAISDQAFRALTAFLLEPPSLAILALVVFTPVLALVGGGMAGILSSRFGWPRFRISGITALMGQGPQAGSSKFWIQRIGSKIRIDPRGAWLEEMSPRFETLVFAGFLILALVSWW